SKDQHNRGDFEKIAKVAADCGIRHCVTSFRDDYAKIRKRTALIPGFRFIDPPIEEKTRVLTQMAAYLDVLGIRLSTCCEKAVMDALPPDSGIEPAACVDHRRLARLFGNDVSLKRDSGQRRKMGCGCHVSVLPPTSLLP
ncbi:MAG: DNA photolyase, partial [Desulfobacterales bacterium]